MVIYQYLGYNPPYQTMRKNKKTMYVIGIVLFSLALVACVAADGSQAIIDPVKPDPVVPQEKAETPLPADQETDPENVQEQITQKSGSYPVLTPANIQEVDIGEHFLPFNPPIGAISGGHNVIAVGDFYGVQVYNALTNEKIMQVDVELPDCQYGWDAYLTLDHTGGFLAIATTEGIEVWQVGGGRVYQSPYLHGRTLDRLTCGLDIPQIALSPRGELLAESGLGVGGEEYGDYFRVTDILRNQVVYAWDGSDGSPHGQLQSFQHLGFSSDGLVLQTFDPFRYRASGEKNNEAFMVWSTETWESVDVKTENVRSSLAPGERMYAVSEGDSVKLVDKASNRQLVQVEAPGCLKDQPCDVIFSPDGGKFAVLERTGSVQFKRETLIDQITVFAVETGEEESRWNVNLKHRQAVRLQNNGKLTVKQPDLETIPRWWTNPAYIGGFYHLGQDQIGFIPQVFDVFGDDPAYAGTCIIDLVSGRLDCDTGIKLGEEIDLSLEKIENGFVLLENDKSVVQVRVPAGTASDVWQIRFKAYHRGTGTGYFCLDRNNREETCVIMKMAENKILKEQIDLYGFISSPKNNLAAFIDREKKELNIFYEDSGRLIQMGSYQAIAYLVKPALFPDGDRALYLVQNVKNGNLYLEEISLRDGKVIKRYDYDGLDKINPNAIAVQGSNHLWVVGDDAGFLHFLDPKTNEIVRVFKAARSGIVDLTFSEDGRQLLLMDQAGEIKILRADG